MPVVEVYHHNATRPAAHGILFLISMGMHWAARNGESRIDDAYRISSFDSTSITISIAMVHDLEISIKATQENRRGEISSACRFHEADIYFASCSPMPQMRQISSPLKSFHEHHICGGSRKPRIIRRLARRAISPLEASAAPSKFKPHNAGIAPARHSFEGKIRLPGLATAS